MILSRRVALGGVQLDELDASIVIRSVDPGITRENVSTVNRMGGSGQRVTSRHWEAIEANVGFAIDLPKTMPEERRAVYEKAMAWAARKGWLALGHMTGKRLYVDQVIYPSSGDPRAWTDEFTLTFRALNVPFWQDEAETSATARVSSGQILLEVPGNAETVLDITAENISGMTIPDFKVAAGKSSIELKGVNLGGSETLTIRHGTDGLLQMKAGSRNVYSLYTGSDDLFVSPGNIRVNITSKRAVKVTASCFGRWIG